MRRADRLFQIVQHFRGGRLVTAQKLGQWLEVSERTIYRDIADLQSTGVPIDGEAGVGYMMREGFDLPPLMFTRDEIVALVAGARMVRAFGGATMARAAEEALVKIGAVLPDAEKDRIARTEIHAPMWVVSDADRAHIDRIERAVEKREVLTLDYRDEAGRPSARDVRPLGLWFWGKVWTLVAWCEMRSDFRAFRIDRIAAVIATGRTYKPERGKQLADFYRSMERGERPGAAPGAPAGIDLTGWLPALLRIGHSETMRPVEIVDYDASWPILFAAERDGLLALLDDLVDAIHHIGSTAVPGLAAKPKIDLDVVLRSDDIIPDAVARVRATGVYADHGDPYGDGRWTFTRGRGQGVRLYVCGPANRAHCERLRFRDWLRAHPEDCAAYEALKRRLAAEAHGDFAAYTSGKSAFVSNILGKASLARSTLRS